MNGTFISDLRNSDGTRTTNYTGSLAGAFSTMASLGASGCGFEQHLRAAQVALDEHPANVGFRRPDAALVVVVLAEDEDCSAGSTALFSPDASLGPFGSFRCFRYGVTCDVGGATPDDMNVPGIKAGCRSNEGSTVIAPVAPIIAFLETLVSDPRMLLLAVIAGDPEPVEVALITPPGGGSGAGHQSALLVPRCEPHRDRPARCSPGAGRQFRPPQCARERLRRIHRSDEGDRPAGPQPRRRSLPHVGDRHAR